MFKSESAQNKIITLMMDLKTEADLKGKFQESSEESLTGFNILKIGRPSLNSILPFTEWFPRYVRGGWREGMQKDVYAGLVMGIMLISQGMAYAKTALLPPEYGFYTSITPSLVYMLLGSCSHLQARIVEHRSLFFPLFQH
jgi:hypothetical protein